MDSGSSAKTADSSEAKYSQPTVAVRLSNQASTSSNVPAIEAVTMIHPDFRSPRYAVMASDMNSPISRPLHAISQRLSTCVGGSERESHIVQGTRTSAATANSHSVRREAKVVAGELAFFEVAMCLS